MITEVLERVRVRLGVPAERWGVGGGAERLAAPPRYLWVPKNDRFTAPMKATNQFRQLYTRLAVVECRLWGADLGDAETRLHALIAALRAVVGATVSIDAAVWDESRPNDLGQLVIVTVALPIPVTDKEITRVSTGRVTTIECDDSSSPDDGFIECCEDP